MTASHPDLGTILSGRYRLVRQLGEGGMGVVFEAVHLHTDRRVAVKWLHERIAAHPDARARMIREARATGRVTHPNVVSIHDVVDEDDCLFLVMELLEGETLEDALSRGDVPIERAIRWLLAAMRGAAEAHRAGVIHRDINPGNIFLARHPDAAELVPKLVDFGISKLDAQDQPELTQLGTALGTPHYTSFEQLCNAGDVDARADVYSFAVVLYRIVTGRRPFEGASFSEIAAKIGTSAAPAPHHFRADLPAPLVALIERGMARDRDRRTPDLDTFLAALTPYSHASAFAPPARADEAEAVPILPTRKAPLMIMLAALLACVAAGLAGLFGATRTEAAHSAPSASKPAMSASHVDAAQTVAAQAVIPMGFALPDDLPVVPPAPPAPPAPPVAPPAQPSSRTSARSLFSKPPGPIVQSAASVPAVPAIPTPPAPITRTHRAGGLSLTEM
jgi:eukaryotic-like serine/threonine-protein kinase